MVYDFNNLYTDLLHLNNMYENLSVFTIGSSVLGKNLYCLKLGCGSKRIFFNAAHHGMEWLTAKILVQFTDDLLSAQMPVTSTIYILPMVNPDGVEISETADGWQANANGVDLNHNYDALWHLSKQSEKEHGILGPGPTRYSGPYCESEPESRAVADFTRQNNFDAVFALHSQGEVFYRDFCGFVPEKSYDYSARFEAVSPYRLDTVNGIASYGGYKDWFINKFKRPGFTIEVGKGKNPLPLSKFDTTYRRVYPLLCEAIK